MPLWMFPDEHRLDVQEVLEKYQVNIHDGLTQAQIEQALEDHGPNTNSASLSPTNNTFTMIGDFIQCSISCCMVVQIIPSIVFSAIFFDVYFITFSSCFVFLSLMYCYIGRNICKYVETNSYATAFDYTTKYKTTVIRNNEESTISSQLLVSGYLKKYKIITKKYQMQTNDDIINLIAVYCRGFDNQKIDSSNLVPGDIVLINSGDAIRADMRVLECSKDFIVDFTHVLFCFNYNIVHKNEVRILSNPNYNYRPITNKKVEKDDHIRAIQAPNLLYYGKYCAKGNGKAIVVRTGQNTYHAKSNKGLSGQLDRNMMTLEGNCTIEMIHSTTKKACYVFLICMVLLIVNVYLDGDVLGIIGLVVSIIVFVLCLWGIISVFKNDKELTGQLNQYQLYCKDKTTQLKLSDVDVIMVDIDTVLMTYDQIDSNSNSNSNINSKLGELSELIKKYDHLGVSLIITSKLEMNNQIIKDVSDAILGNNDVVTKYKNDHNRDLFISAAEVVDGNVSKYNHKILTNVMNVKDKAKIIDHFQREQGKFVLFISNNPLEASNLKFCDIGIALGGDLSTDIEKDTCNAICKSNKPLQTIFQSIETSKSVKTSYVYLIADPRGKYH